MSRRLNPDYDLLRLAMVKQLAKEDVRFDFAVQFQTDADTMSIEDPGIQWSEVESPFRKIATIKIPRQEFDSEKQRELPSSFLPPQAYPQAAPAIRR